MNRPLHVCIVGPDGVGKTTIANHIIDSMESQGWKVVRLNARPKSVAVSYTHLTLPTKA